MQKSSAQKYCSKPTISPNRAQNKRNAKGSSTTTNFHSSWGEETYLKAKMYWKFRRHASLHNHMFKLILLATAKALSFSRPILQSLAVALLIVLKVEFKFDVILCTVHYHFCFLNSWTLEQNSLESAPIIMCRRKNTSPERFKFFFLSSHHTTKISHSNFRNASIWRAMFPVNKWAPKKSQSRLRYYHGILFYSSQ